MNSSACRCVPNWLVSCCWKIEFSLLWMAEADIDGSNTATFGPRSGAAVDWSTGTTWNRWAALPLHVYCTNRTLSASEAPGSSRHLPLCRLTNR